MRRSRLVQMLAGLAKLRDHYEGQYWLEIFILNGVTTVEAQLNMLTHCVKLIAPDKVQLNTVTRPPAEQYAESVPPERLHQIADDLSNHCEVIAAYPDTHATNDFQLTRDDILNLLRRRPCSLKDIANGLCMHINEVTKQINRLVSDGEIKTAIEHGTVYYEAAL